MKPTKTEYAAMVRACTPPTPTAKNCAFAFLTGGCICTLGQALQNFFLYCGITAAHAPVWASVALIGLGALLTALGLYDNLAKHAGAGTLVPVTGFANSIAAPALEFKTEGYVAGLAAKMFVIAGPVLVYGTAAGVLGGVFYFLLTR